MLAVVAGGFVPGLLLAASAAGRSPRGTEPLRGLAPVAAFAALQPVVYGLAYHGHYSWAPWYYAVQPMMAALLGASLLSAVLAAAPRAAPRALAVAAAALLAVSLAGVARWRHEVDGPLHVAARWARDHVAEDARVGAWHAGAIGYLSSRQVVNLDGVVNTLSYLRREQYDQCAYWDGAGLTHLVDVFEAREGSTALAGSTLPVSSFYAACAERLELVWESRVPGNPGWPKAFRIRPASGPAR
jgi:hypothetical protein